MWGKLLVGVSMAAAVWLAGTTNASALTYTDVFTPFGGPVLIDGRYKIEPYRYIHSILNHGFKLGDALEEARLTLKMYDDAPPADKEERVMVNLDGQYYGTFWVTGAPLVLAVEPTLLLDGILNVALTRSKGDFLFAESTLVAHAPEPGTLILLGSGLAGIAVLGFRRRQKANLA